MKRVAPERESSNIAAVGYDEDTQTLEVEFKPNPKTQLAAVWQYWPVHQSLFEAMLDPYESAGRVFSTIKRDPTVESKKVDELELEAVTTR